MIYENDEEYMDAYELIRALVNSDSQVTNDTKKS